MNGGLVLAEKKNTVAIVRDIAKPIADSLGLILWDVRFQKEGANWYLRIFIDKEGGIEIDDCVNMSHAIEEPLDRLDPIEQSYNLQVSSPGIERDLVADEHFVKYVGEKIMLKLPRAVDGMKEFHGILEKYENGVLTVSYGEDKTLEVNKKETSWVRADDFPGFN
ncbi:MAG: ribosome maturation factor RimP [Clostridia bacterium]|nr:ribosome maturation factor RimP [Clostridia bacterium]